ncbi:signal peptide peptidase SppA [bacterium]|nr:signal peptide peptidase SppA [bacterium]
MRTLKNIIVTTLAILGGITLVLIILLIGAISKLSKTTQEKKVPNEIVLSIDFSTISADWISSDPLMRSIEKKISVVELVRILKEAESDAHVKGLFADISHLHLSYAQIEEIRNAIQSFTASGKTAIAWADTFNEGAGGMGSFYLSTVFSQNYMQEAGMATAGIHGESLFLREALDKLKIEPIGAHRKEYKTYWNMFQEKGYTKAHKESITHLLKQIFSTVSSSVEKDKKAKSGTLLNLANSGPWAAKKLKTAGLITAANYRSEALAEAKKSGGEFLSIFRYHEHKTPFQLNALSGTPPASIALIYIGGGIHRGRSSVSFSGEVSSAGSHTIAAAIKKAKKDPNIVGLILRVNSPGGSVVASETIWHETMNSKKPIVVSMSSVAASGGYYVAMNADRIFVQPSTITGSIGVVMGKFYTKEFWKNFGLNYEYTAIGDNEMMYNSLTKLSEKQFVLLNKQIDDTYNIFVDRAAKGRKLTFEKLESMAKGRVWTGRDAVKMGLADEFGGINEAIAYIKKEKNLSDTTKTPLVEFPKTQNIFDMLMGNDDENSMVLTPFSPSLVAPAFRPLLSTIFPTLFQNNNTGIQSATDITVK